MPDGDGTLGASREFVQITAAMRTGVLGAVGVPTVYGALAGVPELLSCCQGQLSEQLSELLLLWDQEQHLVSHTHHVALTLGTSWVRNGHLGTTILRSHVELPHPTSPELITAALPLVSFLHLTPINNL